MTETQIRFFFLALGAFLMIVWALTNPYTWKSYFLEFSKKRVQNGIVFITIWVMFQSLIVPQTAILVTPYDQIFQFLGLIMGIGGVGFACWAKITMKSSWGIPAQHNAVKQNKLVTHGPFSYSRNPIYVGLLLFFFGFELSMRSYFLLLLFPALFLVHRAIMIEEKLLVKVFGDEYEAYKSKVPRYLFITE